MAEHGGDGTERAEPAERRFETADALDAVVAAWTVDRNERRCGTTWRFTTADARTKLQSLYPQHDIWR